MLSVKDLNGHLCDSPDTIKTAFMDYYLQLLGSPAITSAKINVDVMKLGNVITPQQALALSSPFTREDVRKNV